jgi:hypothetical protein
LKTGALIELYRLVEDERAETVANALLTRLQPPADDSADALAAQMEGLQIDNTERQSTTDLIKAPDESFAISLRVK